MLDPVKSLFLNTTTTTTKSSSLSVSTSTSNTNTNTNTNTHNMLVRPILIIPGFMSSGLQISKSNIKKEWEGKRIWLNLKSLGLEVITRKIQMNINNNNGNNNGIRGQTQQQQPNDNNNIKSMWLKHIISSTLPEEESELESEEESEKGKDTTTASTKRKTKIHIEAIPGLDGVDYLYPGALTSMATYVFGPLLDFLVQNNYVRDNNLCAAPWDWRKSPSQLTQYLNETIELIEQMYINNNDTSIVLLGHSLGSKMGHYLLCYANKVKGPSWITKHIYSYMPVSGTHNGLPKSIKQVVLVDKSCLDPFLSLEEEIIFARNLPSTPWLFPTLLPKNVPYHQAYIKPQGMTKIRILTEELDFLPFSSSTTTSSSTGGMNNNNSTETTTTTTTTTTKEPSFQLLIALEDIDSNGKKRVRSIVSPWKKKDGGSINFTNDTFVFMTDHHQQQQQQQQQLHDDVRIQLYVQQKGGRLKIQKEKIMTVPNRFIAWSLRCLPTFLATILELLYNKLFCCCIVDTLLLLPLDTILDQTVWNATYNNNNNNNNKTCCEVPSSSKTNSNNSVVVAISEPFSWDGQNDDECSIDIHPMENVLMYLRRRGGGFCCHGGVNEGTSEPLKSIKIQIRFNPFDDSSNKSSNSNTEGSSRLCGPLGEQPTTNGPSSSSSPSKMIRVVSKVNGGKVDDDTLIECKGISGYELLKREGMDDYLTMIQKLYFEDPFGPLSTSSIDPPPIISRVYAIYGINLPTEIGAIYHRKDTCLSMDKTQNRHWLDDDASIVALTNNNNSNKEEEGEDDDQQQGQGYVVDGGRILETPQTAIGKSGDGTVPYHCLEHVNRWKDTIQDVQTIELEGAEHRSILADPRFHRHVLEHCRIFNESV